jgi:hypothetical protein
LSDLQDGDSASGKRSTGAGALNERVTSWVAFGNWLAGKRIQGKRSNLHGEKRILSNPFEGFGKYDNRADCGTLLSTSGVAPRVARAAMRHSDLRLTMNVYTVPRLLDVHGALNSLPSLNGSIEPESKRATGTTENLIRLCPPKYLNRCQKVSIPVKTSKSASRLKTIKNPAKQ